MECVGKCIRLLFILIITKLLNGTCYADCAPINEPLSDPEEKSAAIPPMDEISLKESTTSTSTTESGLMASESNQEYSGNTTVAPTSNFQAQFQEILLRNQKNLLRLIGLIDRSWEEFGDQLRNTTYRVVLDAQKTIAKAYDNTPQVVNRFIQRIGTLFGSNGDQLNQILNTYRANVKGFLDNWEEHEYDFHDVFQKTFENVNSNLGVPPLPKYNFQWT